MALLVAWRKSLNVFSPIRARYFIRRIFSSFGSGFYVLFKYFGFLIAIDVMWMYLMGDVLLKIRTMGPNEIISITSPGVMFLFFIGTVLWFFTNALLFLALRSQSTDFDDHYYKGGLLHYTQLMLVYSTLFFVGILIMASFGIVQYPALPWVVQTAIKVVGLLVILYWFESQFLFVDILKALENALNLFVYNMPFFILLIVFAYLLNYLCMYASAKLNIVHWIDTTSLLSESLKHNMVQVKDKGLTLFQLIYLKYLRFFLDYFVVSILFSFYTTRKQMRYAATLFS